jgi:amino acid permease
MTNREFLIWLLGYFQLCVGDNLDRKKLFIIKNHLNLVKAVDGAFNEVNAKIFDTVVEALKLIALDTEFFGVWKELKQSVVEA